MLHLYYTLHCCYGNCQKSNSYSKNFLIKEIVIIAELAQTKMSKYDGKLATSPLQLKH